MIYTIKSKNVTDFKIGLLVALKNRKSYSLANLAKIVSKKQLIGASKFYS
ncbi:hypothetical protein [Clostridioides difficile]|nr:hypothetical protein [Clostridioides difficile]